MRLRRARLGGETGGELSKHEGESTNLAGASIYILRCADGSFYTGITRRDVAERVGEHNAGLIDSYTARRLPVILVFDERYERIDEAIASERRIKRWSRAKKIAYIRGDYGALSLFARSTERKDRDPSSFDTDAPRPAQDEGS